MKFDFYHFSLIITVFIQLQNGIFPLENFKILDPSDKMDLDFFK